MKSSIRKNLVIISILLLVTLTALTGCFFDIAIDIANCDVTFSANSYEYTGQEITPDLSIEYFNRVLVLDEDYTLEYYDNVDIGTGHVRINGIGDFKGQLVKDFEIVEPSDGRRIYFFYAPDAEFVSGEKTQVVDSARDIVVPIVRKSGYEFLYWTFNGRQVDFDDISSIPSSSAQFEAKFSLITYTIEYVLYGGENSQDNLSEYTVEDIFDLNDASMTGKKFAGWYLDKDFQDKITTLSGVNGNLVLYAKFVNVDDTVTLSYALPADVNSDDYQEQTLYPGDLLTRPAATVSQDGAKKLVWYIDEAMSVRFNLKYMPDSDLTLYARWEDTLYAGFLDRGWYSLSDIKSIDSYDDMLAYAEFVLYKHSTTQTYKRVTYVSGKANIEAEIVKALGASTFPRMVSVSYSATTTGTCCVYFTQSSSISDQATLSASSEKDYYPQIKSAFNSFTSNRSSSYDEFAINYVENEYECETTDQLFYVLSHGYRPLVSINTPAFRAYNRFKEILRGICDDSMSDLQKARAIYDWLILNVYYDNNVAYGNISSASYKYDAFYIEGVLNGAAVCDGLSKAYASMCAIEGIDCVRVTGKLKDASAQDAGHAWNKIQLMGEWFVSDVTWGNGIVNVTGSGTYEYVNDKYFLFTDYIRSEVDNYNSEQYSQYVADSEYNYFANFTMQIDIKTGLLGLTTSTRVFDLYLDGDTQQGYDAIDELSYIFEYIDKSGVSLEGRGFCVMLGDDMSTSRIQDAFDRYVKRVGIISARIEGYSFFGEDVITIVFSWS